MKNIKKLGIIAGEGNLPLLLIQESKKRNIEPICVLVSGFANSDNYKKVKKISLHIGSVGKALEFFKDNDVRHLVFAGGVKKPSLKFLKTDKKGFKLLKELVKGKLFGDDKVLSTVVKFFDKEGFTILQADDILPDSKIKKGFKCNFSPLEKEYLQDIDLGIKVLKKMGDLDVGQSAVIQQGLVLGIECLEGTAELIKRCGDLKFETGRKPVLVKIKKVKQTKKADLPVIGRDTIKQLDKAGFAGVAIDAKNCIVLNKKVTLYTAEKSGLFVLGI